MKRIILTIIFLALITPVISYAGITIDQAYVPVPLEGNAQFSTLDQAGVVMEHSEAPISTFTMTSSAGSLSDDDDGTVVATVDISNNTRNGFSLTISSQSGGTLAATTNLHGAESIQYSIELETITSKIGKLNAPKVSSVCTTTALQSPCVFISGVQSAPTELDDLPIVVKLTDPDLAEKFDMAGTFSDTITVTYADLTAPTQASGG